jgi:hypothetical protein
MAPGMIWTAKKTCSSFQHLSPLFQCFILLNRNTRPGSRCWLWFCLVDWASSSQAQGYLGRGSVCSHCLVGRKLSVTSWLMQVSHLADLGFWLSSFPAPAKFHLLLMITRYWWCCSQAQNPWLHVTPLESQDLKQLFALSCLGDQGCQGDPSIEHRQTSRPLSVWSSGARGLSWDLDVGLARPVVKGCAEFLVVLFMSQSLSLYFSFGPVFFGLPEHEISFGFICWRFRSSPEPVGRLSAIPTSNSPETGAPQPWSCSCGTP